MRYIAKLTHRIYGINKPPAIRESLKKYIIVIKIIIQSNIISINPSIGDLNPKNNIDHKPFNSNWIINNINAFFTFWDFNP